MQYSIKDIFSPKLFSTLRTYNRVQFGQDALAGILLIIMGLARFGFVIKFVPYPVIVEAQNKE